MKSAQSSVALIKKDSEVPNYALIFEAELILNLRSFNITTACKKGPPFVK